MKSFTEIIKMRMLVKGSAVMLSKYVMEREQLAREEMAKALRIGKFTPMMRGERKNGWNDAVDALNLKIDNYLKEKDNQ